MIEGNFHCFSNQHVVPRLNALDFLPHLSKSFKNIPSFDSRIVFLILRQHLPKHSGKKTERQEEIIN
jgi:hypothetical protein